KGIDSEPVRVQTLYEFVRDQVKHSFDIAEEKCVVTCKASEVLQYGQGICYAKSHLLAALLRSVGIPAGFCYQKLIFSAVKPDLVLHGLNAVYLKSLDKWFRLDARGNKPGVDAQFAVEQERLAFPVRSELGETDGWEVYAVPSRNVINALNVSNNRAELVDNLPTEV
ncbi:MAG TPA: transglutaminase family protein, partial [Bacillota bacterium]|nr:transglutaminase family protein [Bacillota bacterium]